MKLKIRFYQDDTWEVYDTETGEHKFHGSLSDCEAYIRIERNNLFG
jgi:hypothetical protein